MRYQQDLNPIWPQAPRIHNYSHEEIRVKTGLSPHGETRLIYFFLKIELYICCILWYLKLPGPMFQLLVSTVLNDFL